MNYQKNYYVKNTSPAEVYNNYGTTAFQNIILSQTRPLFILPHSYKYHSLMGRKYG